MKKQIILNNQKIDYALKKSRRARRMRLAVYCDGSVVITIPQGLQENIIEGFIREKSDWLISKIAFFNQFKGKQIAKFSRKDYLKFKEKAFIGVENKVTYFSEFYGLKYNKINIKNQKTCWGSCSKKGNLNFNYKIIFLPDQIQDYIVVHEICHLREFNHSKKFWNLVSNSIPNYLELRKRLKQNKISFC